MNPYILESCLGMLPSVAGISNELRPVIIVGARPSSINTEVDRSASSQAFAPAIVNFPVVKTLLRDGLVAPVVARYDECPMSLSEALLGLVLVLATSIEK